MEVQLDNIIHKIKMLPKEKITVVDAFVDFLQHRDDDALLTAAAAGLAENSFQRVWDNPEDAEYDKL